MKHLALYALLVLLFNACSKDPAIVPSTDSEELITQIVSAPVVDAVNVTDLNPAITGYIHDTYTHFSIEMVYCAPHLGYEVVLENGLFCYFGLDGHHLDHDGLHGDEGNFHGGCQPGMNHCIAGDTLDLASVPGSVMDYLSDNYPGAMIVTVILKPSGHLGIEMDNGEILMFDTDGEYMNDCQGLGTGGHAHMHPFTDEMGWHCDVDDPGGMGNHGGMDGHHGMGNPQGSTDMCWGGDGMLFDDLPLAITQYVEDTYPDEDILHAMETFSGSYYLRLSNCVRLIFDENGELLYDSGQ